MRHSVLCRFVRKKCRSCRGWGTPSVSFADTSFEDEAERAVMRYPNCFAIVYQAAVMMQVFGLEQSDKALTARALELYERALLLTEQNTNSEISELTIHVAMAECDLMLGRKEKALETLKANNPMGLNNTMIGMWA